MNHLGQSDAEIKRQVRAFYNQVGWKEISEGLYQNARYEDLRPVSQEYIRRCHLRVLRYIAPTGRLFLDAGSGPIQYPEYLEYSKGYARRVCADISLTALKAARQRIGAHGLFVVADVSRLPFATETFDGVVSLHTIHHLPEEDHVRAYLELARVLAPERRAAVVNGWDSSPLMNRLDALKAWMKTRKGVAFKEMDAEEKETGTHVVKHDARWLHAALRGKLNYRLHVWRTMSTNVMRFFIRPNWGGRYWLRLLFWLEDRFPRFFGERGLYPLVVIQK
jgi:SAM-dependent methyltransferase